jgi:hypothetical protein
MRRSLLCACLVLLLCGLVALAAEKTGVITDVKDAANVDKDKTTVVYHPPCMYETGKVPVPVTLPVSKDVKVVRLTFDKEIMKCTETPVEDGIRNEMFRTYDPEKGLRVRIVTEGEGDKETITRIGVFDRKGK